MDSVKPIDMPEVIAKLIKPAKAPSIDFDAISVVAEKVENVVKFSPPDEKELETPESQPGSGAFGPWRIREKLPRFLPWIKVFRKQISRGPKTHSGELRNLENS